ncbi:unnamed protein product [Dovyalis caffra]|uniref:Uncharacterized protein n=1 Tax=Dovyalis caffra TaxID=77055 RepID=A0AAV1QUC4_9ROSI|nr:unnamed protein product [Dovyalis caffra]
MGNRSLNNSGGGDDLKKDQPPPFNNIKWGDLLLNPDPGNILAVGLTGLLAWASVQVFWQLSLSLLLFLLLLLREIPLLVRVLLTGKLHGPDMGSSIILLHQAGTRDIVSSQVAFVRLNERFEILREIDWENAISAN